MHENIEDIVAKIWDIIINTNEKYNLSIKRLKIDKKLQEYFVELLAQKLYKYEEYKKEKFKYNINVDTSINLNIIENKIKSIYFARDLMNMPANILNPETYEDIIKEIFNNNENIQIKIIKWEELKKIWAWWIYNVWKWSIYESKIIILEYTKKKWEKYNAIVWKGLTFDTWWYNIKTTNSIEEMHLDMAGSAVALWTFKHLVETWYKKILYVDCE